MSPAGHYAVVTAAYWGFTLTDGALRTLVLLHFYQRGYSPLTLALLFLLYEFAGIVTNLGGGWLATRFGITRMLAVGLATQVAGLSMLSALDPSWGERASVAWVVVAQGISGVAKDLTKTACKSAIKLTAAAASGTLFHWVAWFTGSKNAIKGLGFFVGGGLLGLVGFRPALWLMAAGLGAVLAATLLSLPPLLGRARPSRSAREFLSKSKGVNLLATARVSLFGARDVWFVVGLPIFLYGNGWSFFGVGGFLAAWTIGYGVVQASTPVLIGCSSDSLSREVRAARSWGFILALVPAVLVVALVFEPSSRPDLLVSAGLLLFGVAFAVNSSLHSYLILAYAGSEKAAEDVGFYYAANAAGRLIGIILSGLLYQAGGLTACLLGATSLLVLSWLTSLALPSRRSNPVLA